MDAIATELYGGHVPVAWLRVSYPSLKPLASWTRDLMARVEQLACWAAGTYPRAYWLGGFWHPASFLSAVLQTAARRGGTPVDGMTLAYTPVMSANDRDVPAPPREGVYIKGFFLEGAGWDFQAGCLKQPAPMELIVPMPLMHFRPVESKRRAATLASEAFYACPLYAHPGRSAGDCSLGTVDLRAGVEGSADPELWVMRGTALLLSLAE